MSTYQRKTLLIIVLINLFFGLQQYFMNQVVVFPSPLNSSIFLIATMFFFFMSVFKSGKVEIVVLLLFLLAALIGFFSDSFILEIISSTQHEAIHQWFNSIWFNYLKVFGVSALLATLPFIAYKLRAINFIYFLISWGMLIVLSGLAFVKLPYDPLIFLGGLSVFFFVILRVHQESIPSGISAGMHLWIIFFLHECFDFWNLSL